MMCAYNFATDTPGTDVFNGGHVRLTDSRFFYNHCVQYVSGCSNITWLTPVVSTAYPTGGRRKYSQSHPTVNDPYELTLPVGWGCILVGTYDDNGTTRSWFQMEATSVERNTGSMAYHTVKDFVSYKWSGLQQGPCGTSNYSDKQPLVVSADDTRFAMMELQGFELPV